MRINFNAPALAPMAYTFFCLKYQTDCQVHKTVFRGGALKLTAERWADLKRINAEVNHAIIPTRNNEGLAAEKWLISPKAGDCHDYAVTKRHELLARGWPARSLLLSEVETSWGEHHLVLVVRTNEGDFVADNLTGNIRSWSNTPYQWVRIQSPGNPMFWSTVASTIVRTKVAKLTSVAVQIITGVRRARQIKEETAKREPLNHKIAAAPAMVAFADMQGATFVL